jgi:hypothetical protein
VVPKDSLRPNGPVPNNVRTYLLHGVNHVERVVLIELIKGNRSLVLLY